MKKVLMIGTGGTIASEMTPDGLTPELTPEQLLRYVPAISGLCQVDCLSLFSIDSTNITPGHWAAVTRSLEENYEKYDGFVISHGHRHHGLYRCGPVLHGSGRGKTDYNNRRSETD